VGPVEGGPAFAGHPRGDSARLGRGGGQPDPSSRPSLLALPTTGRAINRPAVRGACPLVRGAENEDLEEDVRVEDDLAVGGEHPPAGQGLDLAGELLVDELVKLEPQLAHEVGLATAHERALDGRQRLLEHAEHEIVLQIGPRARRTLAPVLVDHADHRVRERGSQTPIAAVGRLAVRAWRRGCGTLAGRGQPVRVADPAGRVEPRGTHVAGGVRGSPAVGGPVEDEDLYRHVGVEDDLAVVGEHARTGQALDLAGEGLGHDVLEGQARAANERAAAALLERELEWLEHVIEHREDDPVVHVGPCAGGSLAVELAFYPRHRVRDRVSERRAAQTTRLIDRLRSHRQFRARCGCRVKALE